MDAVVSTDFGEDDPFGPLIDPARGVRVPRLDHSGDQP